MSDKKCEGCGEAATTEDREGVPLCADCAVALVMADETKPTTKKKIAKKKIAKKLTPGQIRRAKRRAERAKAAE